MIASGGKQVVNLTKPFAEVFIKNTSELGWLDAEIVDYTTAFYTFIRSLHNIANSLKVHIDEPTFTPNHKVISKYLEDMNYVIDTAMDNAYRAFGGLIQNRRHRRSAQHSALFVGTRANNFLLFESYGDKHQKFETTRRRNHFYAKACKYYKK